MGRLKPGASVSQASQDLKTIAANLSKEYPNTNTKHNSARGIGELDSLLGDSRTALFVILGSVALVLLIACGNIANLLLARMRERQREIALRSALGAGKTRIVRQLLAESVVLSVLGGVAGCALAFLCTPAVLALIGDSVPRATDAGVDLRVLSFSFALSFAAGILFGSYSRAYGIADRHRLQFERRRQSGDLWAGLDAVGTGRRPGCDGMRAYRRRRPANHEFF